MICFGRRLTTGENRRNICRSYRQGEKKTCLSDDVILIESEGLTTQGHLVMKTMFCCCLINLNLMRKIPWIEFDCILYKKKIQFTSFFVFSRRYGLEHKHIRAVDDGWLANKTIVFLSAYHINTKTSNHYSKCKIRQGNFSRMIICLYRLSWIISKKPNLM